MSIILKEYFSLCHLSNVGILDNLADLFYHDPTTTHKVGHRGLEYEKVKTSRDCNEAACPHTR